MAIEVKQYKNTGLRYIRGSARTLVGIEDNGVVVLNEDFDDWDRRDIMLAQVLGLAKDPAYSGYDFAYTAQTGSLSAQQRGKKTVKAPVPSAPPPLANPTAEARPVLTAHTMNAEKIVIETELETTREAFVDTQLAEKLAAELVYDEAVVHKAFEETMAVEKEGETIAPKLTFKQQALAFLRGDRSGKQKEKPKHKVSIHDSVIVMLVVIIIVGIGSMAMSGYHIYAYLYNGGYGRPEPVAFITGAIMTLFSAIAFSSARYFINGKKISDWLVGAAFGLFGIIVVAFAMFSTMKVNYDQFKAGSDAKVETVVVESTAVKSAQKTDTFLQGELDRLAKVITDNQKEADNWHRKWADEAEKEEPDPNLRWQYWTSYDAAQKRANKATADRKPYEDKALAAIGSDVQAEDKVKQAAQDNTIFGLFARLFGWDMDTLLFIVYVIPAIFYDLMCPFALTVGMMLYDRVNEPRKEEKE